MPHTIFGRLNGYLCDDCVEPLEGVVVRFYAADAPDVTARAAADVKDTATLVDAADQGRAARLLGEATVGSDGSFRSTLAESYGGGALDVDLYCGTVPHLKPPKKHVAPVQLHLTTFQPRWRETQDGSVAAFDYSVSARIWCPVRARLGAWTICGRVTACDSNEPVMGVRVFAFDADWLQDDPLGSGVTDAAGHYRIDYSADDFKRTPFSPIINIEWVSGPDLYFRIDGPGGAVLLQESRSKGRTPGRENSGPCKCVDLCITGQVPPSTVPTIPMFTNVGSYDIKTDFNPSGTTTAGDLAFTGDIPLIGILPDPLSPQAVEYRFLVNGAPVDATQMLATEIGKLQYFEWDSATSSWSPTWTSFYANNPGATVSINQSGGAPPLVVPVNTAVKADGWIEVPRTNGLVPGGPGRFLPLGEMARLHTTAYTNESFDLTPAVPPLPLVAGDSVPPGQRSSAPTFTITFEARDVGTHASAGTDTLPVIAFSNVRDTYTRHPYWAGSTPTTTGVASIGIVEMVAGGGCAELGDTVHVQFTAYHPYAGQPTVYFDGNPILPAPLSPPVVGGEAASGAAGHVFDISLLAKCAYIVWLSVPLRLTAGYGSIGAVLYDHIAFCKK